MKIDPGYIGHDTPHGLITVISPTKFTWEEGRGFLTVENIQKHLDKMNPKLAKHWVIPSPTGRILPTRNNRGVIHIKDYWVCGYRFEIDWGDAIVLQEFGGINISKSEPRDNRMIDWFKERDEEEKDEALY